MAVERSDVLPTIAQLPFCKPDIERMCKCCLYADDDVEYYQKNISCVYPIKKRCASLAYWSVYWRVGVCWLSECMVCLWVDPECVTGRGCRQASMMSQGSLEQGEVLTVLWDSSRRCAQHAMAAVFPSTGEEPALPLQPADSLLPSCGHLQIVLSNGFQ